jgi:hypothetical protein
MRRQGTPGKRFMADANRASATQREVGTVPGSPQKAHPVLPKAGGILPSDKAAAKSFNRQAFEGKGTNPALKLPGPQPGGILPKPPSGFNAPSKTRTPSTSPARGIPMQRTGSTPNLPGRPVTPGLPSRALTRTARGNRRKS